MRNLIYLLLLLPEFAQATPLVVGEAFALDGDKLLYRERHTLSEDGQRRRVLYQAPDGEILADKTLVYHKGLLTPEFTQRNYLSDSEVAVRWSDGDLILSDAEQQRRVEPRRPLVIDAGFDEFIRHHWSRLLGGETLTFHFPMPARGQLLELRARHVPCSYAGAGEQCFQLQPTSWLLRLLAAPIELGYDADSKQLRRYRGIGNVEDSRGREMVVDIRYYYSNNTYSDNSYRNDSYRNDSYRNDIYSNSSEAPR